MTRMCLLESKFQHIIKALSVWSCFLFQPHFLGLPFIFYIPTILDYFKISQHTTLAFNLHLFVCALLHRSERNVIPPVPPQHTQNVYTSFKNLLKQNFFCGDSYKPALLNTMGWSFFSTQDFEHPLLALILLFCKNLYVSLQLQYDFLERKDHVLLTFGVQESNAVLSTYQRINISL